MIKKIISYLAILSLCMQLNACVTQVKPCDCKSPSNKALNEGAKKMNSMIDEIYAYPEPRNFDVKDVSHVIRKHLPVGSTEQQIIEVLKKQYGFEIFESEMDSTGSKNIYAHYKKGMPLFDMPATIVIVTLGFNVELNRLSNISATYTVNQ